MLPSRACPLLSSEGLCRIQLEHSAELMPKTCVEYPRVHTRIGGVAETSLSLSCPEAARLVLLNQGPLTTTQRLDSPEFGISEKQTRDPFEPLFHPVRSFALRLISNRAYPLWQRLFLLDLFARRFDSLPPEERTQRVPQQIAEFEAALASGSLSPAMERLPVDPVRHMEMVLLLAGMLLHESYLRPRFVECVDHFTRGIGNGPGATLGSLAAHYARAHDRFLAPFVTRQPSLLEHYLINTIFRTRFPFGRAWALSGAVPSMARESVCLVAQFALMRGLLVGVAGFHGESFSISHVVHTVQSASRHFDHHANFLTKAHALLVEHQMEGQLGLGILLQMAAPLAPVSLEVQMPQPMPTAGGARMDPARPVA